MAGDGGRDARRNHTQHGRDKVTEGLASWFPRRVPTAHTILMNKHKTTLADTSTRHRTGNNLTLVDRTELNSLINRCLASAIDLQLRLKQAHWNVQGPYFMGLRELFDNIEEVVEGYVDRIAQRMVQLGGTAEGTVRVATPCSQFDMYPHTPAEGFAHINVVATALSTFGQQARVTIDGADELKDAGTVDLFTEISNGMDKWLWFVDAHTQATN